MNLDFSSSLTEKESSVPRRAGENYFVALGRKLWTDKVLYLMLFPTILFFIIFRVGPILNMRLAFFTFRAFDPWEFVGLRYFNMLFSTPVFTQIITNTLVISFLRIVLIFPFVVLFAILLNEIRSNKFRKYVQIVSYAPNLFSWVVIASIWITFLSVQNGAVNALLSALGLQTVDFMTNRDTIRGVIFTSMLWRTMGWDSIIYMITIFGINRHLFEAAALDGANRVQIIRHVILPALYPAMTTIFILNFGFFLRSGFEHVFTFTNDAVQSRIDIIDTYVFRIGIQQGQFSFASAAGLMQGAIGVFLILATHLLSKKFTGKGVW